MPLISRSFSAEPAGNQAGPRRFSVSLSKDLMNKDTRRGHLHSSVRFARSCGARSSLARQLTPSEDRRRVVSMVMCQARRLRTLFVFNFHVGQLGVVQACSPSAARPSFVGMPTELPFKVFSSTALSPDFPGHEYLQLILPGGLGALTIAMIRNFPLL